MSSAFLGAYWQKREESREACAFRISSFLEQVASVDNALSAWFLKGRARRAANAGIEVSAASISELLRSNNRDITGGPIVELGFSIWLWNGSTTALSGTIGAFSQTVRNHIVLETDATLSEKSWRDLAQVAVRVFDPDSLVVSSKKAEKWLTYSGGHWQRSFSANR